MAIVFQEQERTAIFQKLTLHDAWNIIRKRRYVIYIITSVIVGTTVIWTFSQPVVYKASVKILVQQQTPSLVSFQDFVVPERLTGEYAQTQFQVLASKPVAKRVVSKLKLDQDPRFSRAKDPAAAILRMIEIEPIRNSRLAYLYCRNGDPVLATQIANTFVEAYVEQFLENRISTSRQAIDWLTQRLETFKQKVTDSERKLQEYNKAHQIADIAEVDANNRLVSQMEGETAQLETELAEMSKRYREKHPKIIALRDKIAVMKERRMEVLKYALSQNQIAIDYGILHREVESNKKVYEALLGRLKETDVIKEGSYTSTPSIEVVEPAEVPSRPVAPRKTFNILLSVLVSLFGSVGLCFFLEYLDNTVKSQEDVEKYCQLPFLGMIPSFTVDEEDRSTGLITFHDPESSAAESFRSIRTALLFSNPDKPVRTFLVTSPSPMEGKTSVASNVAVTLAQTGSRVLLVDSDMRKPMMHKVFKLDNRNGLSSLLVSNVDPDEFVQKTLIDNLFVLTCGPIPPNPSELMGSQRMQVLLKQLVERYDKVIFDTPPFVAVTDSIILSTLLDGVIFVGHYSRTNRDALIRGKNKFAKVHSKILGVTINNKAVREDSYYYSYYYRYGYGYGRRRRKGEKTPSQRISVEDRLAKKDTDGKESVLVSKG